jgi:hypothetical protein
MTKCIVHKKYYHRFSVILTLIDKSDKLFKVFKAHVSAGEGLPSRQKMLLVPKERAGRPSTPSSIVVPRQEWFSAYQYSLAAFGILDE